MARCLPAAVTDTGWCFTAPTVDVRCVGERERLKHPWMVGSAIGLGAAALSAAPAQAAPVEFPGWATVTGTVPDDAGFDRAAADANNWTFSWSTDAQGVVTFVYADGATSSSADVPESPQIIPTALWSAAPSGEDIVTATPDVGMADLAAVAAAPFSAEVNHQATQPISLPASGVSDQAILETAYQGLGGAYVWGGTDFMAWDCSGYVQWVYARHGLEIPRVTWDQFAAATPTASPRPGDLVSQNNEAHVGIFLGGDRMISALNPEEGTVVHSIHAMPLDGFYTYR